MNEKQRQYLISAIILGALCAALSAYYWFGIATPEITENRDRITKLETDIKELNGKLKTYNEFLVQRDQIERAVEAIALATERLPTERNEQAFITAMRDFIAKTGVDMLSLDKLKPNEYNDWREFPHLMSGTTRYLDFVQFLSLVEQNADFFMRVKEFSINNDEKRPSLHPFELTIASFMWKE